MNHPVKLKAGMTVIFSSLGQKPEVVFKGRILAIRDIYAIVKDTSDYGPRHVRLTRLTPSTPDYWVPTPPVEGPRYA